MTQTSQMTWASQTLTSQKFGQFPYFDTQLGKPNWTGKKILDFGGNVGSVLEESNSLINNDNYWCIDVAREAIEKARITHPDAHWIFYDRYNFQFNPEGVPGLPVPDVGCTFDYIVSYSVFTHTSEAEMIELVNHLKTLLNPGGMLAFTFEDINHLCVEKPLPDCNLKSWKHKGEEIRPSEPSDFNRLLEKVKLAAWCTLVNEEDLYYECEDIKSYTLGQKKMYEVFYATRYMETIFPHGRVLPPVAPEKQHCCVIKAEG